MPIFKQLCRFQILFFCSNRLSSGLLDRDQPLPIKHFLLCALGSFSLLTLDLLDALLRVAFPAKDGVLDFLCDQAPRQKAVHGLRTFLLDLHHNAGGNVLQNNAGRNLVDVLAAGSGGSYELLGEIRLAQPELLKKRLELTGLLIAYRNGIAPLSP